MSTINKIIIALTLYAITIMVLSNVLFPENNVTIFLSSNNVSYYLLNVTNLFALIILIQNGTIFKTKYWKIILLFFPVVIIGLLAKIQHWEIANMMLISGAIGIQLVYLFWFIRKELMPTLIG